MTGGRRGAPVERIPAKKTVRREAPRALLSCRARRPEGPRLVRCQPARSPPPFDRNLEEHPQAGLLSASCPAVSVIDRCLPRLMAR